MLTRSLITAVSLSAYAAWAASPSQFTLHNDAPKCWPGEQIHDPCDGYITGCTKDGILVTCDGDPADGNMIFSSFCDNYNCECIDGKSECKPDATKCWTGNIHDYCNGATTGCASGGILVKCDEDSVHPADSQMIFEDECGGTFGNGTCHCDGNGESTC